MNDEISKGVEQVITIPEILRAREAVKKIYIDERIENYILNIVLHPEILRDTNLMIFRIWLPMELPPVATIFLGQAAGPTHF